MHRLIEELDKIYDQYLGTGMTIAESHTALNQTLTELTQALHDTYLYTEIKRMSDGQRKRRR